MPGSHALLSPSSASRWLTCTPSARLEAEMPEKSNEAADEGTLAHKLSELLIGKHFGKISSVLFKTTLAKYKKHELYSNDMLNYCSEFLAYIVERFEAHEEADTAILLEEQVDLGRFAPGSFGTVDNTILSPHTLEITDLKYGKGVFVDGNENKQMMLYALGMIERYFLAYGFRQVRMNIYQPRLNNFTGCTMTVKELLKWADKELKHKAELAYNGAGKRVAGEHCKFCKVKNTCRALADYNLAIAQESFPDADTLTDEELAEILEKADSFTSWLNDIKGYALEEALKGKSWPGFKLVHGRSTRIINKPSQLIARLERAGIDSDLYLTQPTLLPITKLETSLGHADFQRLCSKYVVKPAGSPTLVPEGDKRANFNDAKEAFKNIDLP